MTTKKKDTIAEAIPLPLTTKLLISKRRWVWLIANVVKMTLFLFGVDVTDDMEVTAVDMAMVYGAFAMQALEFAALLWTKVVDEKKK
jgi:hypothetical protein